MTRFLKHEPKNALQEISFLVTKKLVAKSLILVAKMFL